MEYSKALEKARLLKITIGMMILFKGIKEKASKAVFDVDAVIKSLEQEEWVSASASLLKIRDFVGSYRDTLSRIELKNNETLDLLEKRIGYIESFIGEQIDKQIDKEESNLCHGKKRISRRSEKSLSTKLQKFLRRRES